eukprot:3542937-Rhodomonas_salina.6
MDCEIKREKENSKYKLYGDCVFVHLISQRKAKGQRTWPPTAFSATWGRVEEVKRLAISSKLAAEHTPRTARNAKSLTLDSMS